jgi:hypothetical protein
LQVYDPSRSLENNRDADNILVKLMRGEWKRS